MWEKNKVVIISVIIALIVGYFFGSLGSGKNGNNTTESLTDGEMAEVGGGEGLDTLGSATAGVGVINVANQVAGAQVRVASVSVNGPTWVTVREDSNGVPGGSILGAALLSTAGAHRDVMVELLVPTTPATRYHVNLFTDDGDRSFDHRTDLLVLDNGQMVSAAFLTQ